MDSGFEQLRFRLFLRDPIVRTVRTWDEDSRYLQFRNSDFHYSVSNSDIKPMSWKQKLMFEFLGTIYITYHDDDLEERVTILLTF